MILENSTYGLSLISWLQDEKESASNFTRNYVEYW